MNVFPCHCGLVCVRCKWRKIVQRSRFSQAASGLEKQRCGGCWANFVRRVLHGHRSISFIPFRLSGAVCSAGKIKAGRFSIHRARQIPAEKSAPLQIIFAQWEHPVREAIQSDMLRLSFISYWAKRNVYSVLCTCWICWLNISYWILVCAFKTFCLFPSLLHYFPWLLRESCCAGSFELELVSWFIWFLLLTLQNGIS